MSEAAMAGNLVFSRVEYVP